MKVKVPLEGGTIDKFSDSGKDAHGMGAERQRMEVETKINHQGEVNRARMMPQKRNILATKTVSGEVHIFDYFKHGTTPDTDEVKPQLKLSGHTKEGYGLSWNPLEEGHLLSGADDQNIFIWDITKETQESTLGSTMVKPTQEFNREHESVVEDVAWHKSDRFIFGSVSDDKQLKLWDVR
jgi:histone-binding protein RBBP4